MRCLTNFAPWQRAIYEEAIRRYGSSEFRVGPPMEGGIPTDCGFWSVRDGDHGDFWSTFDQVSSELKEGFSRGY